MADVFISYSQVDRERVMPLVRAIESAGFSVWWDTVGAAGAKLREMVHQELEQASCVLVAWSKSSISSDWVLDEADDGRKRGILVAVTLDGQEPPHGFRQYLAVSLVGWEGGQEAEAFQGVLRGVNRHVQVPVARASRSANRDALVSAENPEHLPPEMAAKLKHLLWQSSRVQGGSKPAEEEAEDKAGDDALKLNGELDASVHADSGRVSLPAKRFRILAVVVVSITLLSLSYGNFFFGRSSVKPVSPSTQRTPKEQLGEPPLAGQVFQDHLMTNAKGPQMVVVPAGTFRMGDLSGDGSANAKPGHWVTISKPFAIGVAEVTFADYVNFSGDTVRFQEAWRQSFETNPSDPSDWHRLPITGVSWEDATGYAAWLSQESNMRYRLPTEAEWEYAARAGTQTRYSFGDDEAALGEYAWFEGNSNGQVHPVATRKPNPWGLYDMHGNVEEWVQDCVPDSNKNAPSERGAAKAKEGATCPVHRLRGGSWRHTAEEVGSADGRGASPNYRANHVGFRLVRDL